MRTRAGGRRLQVLEALSLGPRRQVCLLRAGEDVLCLALGEGGIRLLARFRGEAARRLLAEEGREGGHGAH
jgi:flagellar biogenesis protein FliO